MTATSRKKKKKKKDWGLDEASGVSGERKDNYLEEEKVSRN